MKEIFELLKQVLNREFIRAVLSNPRTKDGVVKAKVRPLEKNGDFMFQVEKFTKTQAFHENINCKDAAEILAGHMENFRHETFGLFRVIACGSLRSRCFT